MLLAMPLLHSWHLFVFLRYAITCITRIIKIYPFSKTRIFMFIIFTASQHFYFFDVIHLRVRVFKFSIDSKKRTSMIITRKKVVEILSPRIPLRSNKPLALQGLATVKVDVNLLYLGETRYSIDGHVTLCTRMIVH